MYYVYLLLLNSGKLYTGSTIDLQHRFSQHEQGKVASTKTHRPLKLIYYEAYLNVKDARLREQYLKTGDGRKSIRKQLQHLIANMRP